MTGNKVALAALLVSIPSVALADGSTALAQQLFDEGVKLMEQERYAEACPKLAESQRLDPGGGTLLNLGLCREKEGKLATAWTIYNESLSQAIKDGRKDREATAKDRVNALGPQLAKLTIEVPAEVKNLPGLEVTLDGVPIGRAAFGVAAPIDSGNHTLTASATTKKEWTHTVNVERNGETVRVDIPPLENAPLPPGEKTITETNPLRTAGFIVGGVGVAALVPGIIGGALAISKRSESNTQCPMERCSAQGVALNNDANAFAWVSNIAFGVAIAGIATGAILIIVGKPTVRKTIAFDGTIRF